MITEELSIGGVSVSLCTKWYEIFVLLIAGIIILLFIRFVVGFRFTIEITTFYLL